MEQCLDRGITSFDHADIYGGYTVEALFGQALALSPGLRQRMQLITKCGIKSVHAQRAAHQLKSYDTSAPMWWPRWTTRCANSARTTWICF
jgi:predicted oxidoreductase